MRSGIFTLVATLVLPILSGCMGSEPSAPDNDATPTDQQTLTASKTQTTGPGSGQEPNGTRIPVQAIWSNCHGFGAAFNWVGHHDQFDPPPHSAWEDATDEGTLVTGLLMDGLDCERFTLGAFERPVKFYFEIAGLDATPPDCERDNITISYDALESIWVNDAEVADYLREVYGMPAIHVEIETERRQGDPFDTYVWTMNHGDGSTSWYEAIDTDDYAESNPFNHRLFWWNDTALGYMDWTIGDRVFTNTFPTGHLEPPSMMSQWHTDYTGPGVVVKETRATGSIALFEDLVCQEPR